MNWTKNINEKKNKVVKTIHGQSADCKRIFMARQDLLIVFFWIECIKARFPFNINDNKYRNQCVSSLICIDSVIGKILNRLNCKIALARCVPITTDTVHISISISVSVCMNVHSNGIIAIDQINFKCIFCFSSRGNFISRNIMNKSALYSRYKMLSS